VSASEATTTERTEEQKLATGVTLKKLESVALSPTWMTVSICLPRSYFEEVWHQRNPAVEGEDPKTPDLGELRAIETEVKTDIESAVTPLLPRVAQGEDPYPRVQVVSYTETPPPVPAAPPVTSTAMQWLSMNWQTLGMFGMALVGVFVLRGMVRSAQTNPDDFASSPADILPAERLAGLATTDAGDAGEDDGDMLANSLKARFNTTSRSLRDELTELVREDPGAAASVLQNWIGETN
jgi:flagellar M-ring protein FliF